MAAIKAFIEGKGDLAAAQAGGAELRENDCVNTEPVSATDQHGRVSRAKRAAKPEIWAQWDQFIADAANGSRQAEALNAALQSGDKAAITAALANGWAGRAGKNPNRGLRRLPRRRSAAPKT